MIGVEKNGSGWFWEIETIKKVLESEDKPRPRYIITDDKEEFIQRLESIAENALKATKDNLRYLEQLDRIKELKAGAEVEDVFPWIKDCNHL